MAIRNYDIPGTEATIVDYQIVPAPITNPGEIVIVLGDLPDTVSVEDPLNPGAVMNITVPANQPILINEESDLGVISGAAFKSALIELGKSERNLETVNVLPILNSSLPLALCKAVKRNGERPNPNNTKELYEAFEYAYENLGNYPAGKIIPMGISIEDTVLMDSLADETIERFDTFSINNFITSQADYGSSVLASPTADLKFITEVFDYQEHLKFDVKPVILNDNIELSFSFKMVDPTDASENVIFTYQTAVTVNNQPLGTYSYLNSYTVPGGILNKLVNLKNGLLDINGNKVTAPVNLTDDADSTYLLAANWSQNISDAQSQHRVVIADPNIFDDNDITVAIDSISFPVIDGSETIGTFTFNAEVNGFNANEVDYTDPNALVINLANVDASKFVYQEPNDAIGYLDFYAGADDTTDFLYLDSSGGDIADVIDSANTESITQLDLPNGVDGFEAVTTLETVHYDRSFNTVMTYDANTEIYSEDFVGIVMEKDKNFITQSSSLAITNYQDYYNGEHSIDINGVTIALPGLVTVIDPFSSNEYIVEDDYEFVYQEVLTIKFLKGLKLPTINSTFEYDLSIVPIGAGFDTRLVDFCAKLTHELNDCTAVLGTRPPVTISPEDIKAQVERLSLNLAGKNYSTPSVDNGLYLTVTCGSQKVDGIGGITNFPAARVSAFDNTNKTVDLIGSLEFHIGDRVDLEITKKGRIYVYPNTVVSITRTTTGVQLELSDDFSSTIFGNTALNTARTCSLTNSKDNNGSYLAALYAVEANNYSIDKAPFNVAMPGDAEIFYTREQLDKLLDVNLTPISRNAFNTSGIVVDTPTMAQDESDFTDQGTVGLIMYFIRQLRTIAAPRKGQRFGSGARQIAFQTELEAPFENQVGDTITAYNLVPNWSKLQSEETLDIEFSIREAKKLKVVKITAKLF